MGWTYKVDSNILTEEVKTLLARVPMERLLAFPEGSPKWLTEFGFLWSWMVEIDRRCLIRREYTSSYPFVLAISNAVWPSLDFNVVFVFAASSKSREILSPLRVQICRGAIPSLLLIIFVSAPCTINTETVSEWPLLHAASNGVSPSLFFQLTSNYNIKSSLSADQNIPFYIF